MPLHQLWQTCELVYFLRNDENIKLHTSQIKTHLQLTDQTSSYSTYDIGIFDSLSVAC